MPLFHFFCSSCNVEQTRILSAKITEITCACGGSMSRKLPLNVAMTVKVASDARRGVQLDKNLNAKLKERLTKQHDKFELEEKIDKYGMDDALKHGWVKKVRRV